MTSTKPNPYHRVNLWSQLFHGWISPLIQKSHKQDAIHLTDLYDLLPEYESTKLSERFESHWFAELKQTNRQPSLVRATLKTMGWKPLLIGLMLIPTVNKIVIHCKTS
jgi:hypothetical protein